jgi:BlaI family transcriptional regulator, penicillinase repressor
MPKKLPSLGELEILVLHLVWEHQPCTERKVSDLVQQQRAVARTTVLKTIQRLESKGLLRRAPGDGPIRWRAAVERRHALPELVQRFVHGVLGGSAAPLAAYLTAQQDLSASDVKALERIVRKLAASENVDQSDL